MYSFCPASWDISSHLLLTLDLGCITSSAFLGLQLANGKLELLSLHNHVNGFLIISPFLSLSNINIYISPVDSLES